MTSFLGCDCDCGIWDPDCDVVHTWGYGIAAPGQVGATLRLLDAERTAQLLKRFDKNQDHALSAPEMLRVRSQHPTDPKAHKERRGQRVTKNNMGQYPKQTLNKTLKEIQNGSCVLYADF